MFRGPAHLRNFWDYWLQIWTYLTGKLKTFHCYQKQTDQPCHNIIKLFIICSSSLAVFGYCFTWPIDVKFGRAAKRPRLLAEAMFESKELLDFSLHNNLWYPLTNSTVLCLFVTPTSKVTNVCYLWLFICLAIVCIKNRNITTPSENPRLIQ